MTFGQFFCGVLEVLLLSADTYQCKMVKLVVKPTVFDGVTQVNINVERSKSTQIQLRIS